MFTLKRTRLSDRRKPTQEDVARAVGINQGFYSRLESGQTNASVDIAVSLASYFGVAVSDIFTPALYSSTIEHPAEV